ncbi:hypothetical protein DUNSADRAFT_16590 [Dunaliella salina]|uniref:Uncharacterized protein n=1 Tax=Dunaliella salina TaxID=3046 RepID=A0ABQ7H0X4_DUNSA|nr:hypothetical protein DUNSADRAFT_16590 [Dunaliella salina]|eukprot:KAF5840499.1 hypothetical protein DUNSADRAFT_16590 [Dunaliella salina]
MLCSKASTVVSAPRCCIGRHIRPKRKHTSKLGAASTDTPHLNSYIWSQFAENASGEWEGATASFNPPNGQPIPLDAYYVPQAFRDWGVELCDWQTTCSTLAEAEKQGSLKSICRRMMPTVGCEADAVAFTEEAQCTDGGLCAVAPDGGYVAGPLQLDAEDGRARVEFCLPFAPVAQQQGQQMEEQKRERVRVVTRLQVNWLSKRWELGRVEVHKERYDGPFKGQIDLCGCGGGMPGFSQSEPVSHEQAKSAEAWPITNAWAYDKDPQGGLQLSESAPASPLIAAHQGARLTLLPLGLALQSSVDDDKGEVFLQLLMVVGEIQKRVALCSYAGGQMQLAVLGSHKG